MTRIDDRARSWLESLGIGIQSLIPLAGDVSPRRYFRVFPTRGLPAILAAYPDSQGDAFRRFLITTRLFESARIRVPEVRASDPRSKLMLLEDLGSVSLFDRVTGDWADARPHIEGALQSLAALAARPAGPFAEVNPPLDARRLEAELRDARAVFLDLEEFSGDEATRRALQIALGRLTAALALVPLVPAHRDFMSRNLMLPPNASETVVIDHQDACLAPRCYDVASLLNDSFFPTPGQEEHFLDVLALDREAIDSYRRCAVQRTLKATATYIKFALRGSDRHLPLIGPTLSRTARQLERLPEGKDLPRTLYARWRDPQMIVRGLDRVLLRSKT